MALVSCPIYPCRFPSILTCQTSHFSIKNPKFEFWKLKWCGSNLQRCSDVVAFMSHWVWYFKTHISAVVFKMANSVFSLVYILIWNRIGILVWIQFLCVKHCNSFPEHSLVHFSDIQRISWNYLNVLVIIVAIKFIEINPKVFWSESNFVGFRNLSYTYWYADCEFWPYLGTCMLFESN
jgi:hypothetical protein